ncbi:hypothetical protein O3P69_016648 [Scylla paramamosain]|uniref:Uncharacterized protein n=1 Tax=Scylla paramamosain TaxID=85552 RepID=A0AAW0SYW7_SCYPA
MRSEQRHVVRALLRGLKSIPSPHARLHELPLVVGGVGAWHGQGLGRQRRRSGHLSEAARLAELQVREVLLVEYRRSRHASEVLQAVQAVSGDAGVRTSDSFELRCTKDTASLSFLDASFTSLQEEIWQPDIIPAISRHSDGIQHRFTTSYGCLHMDLETLALNGSLVDTVEEEEEVVVVVVVMG